MNKNSAIMRLATCGLFLAACSSPAALAQSAPPSGTFYAGAHATYDKDSNLWDDVAVGYLGEHSSDGVHFGAQLGYDLDLGPLFVGAVATFRPNGVSGEHKDLQFSDNIPQYDRSDEKWNAQFAGRAGVSTAGFRLYGKTGLALSRKRYTIIGYLVENEVFSSKTTTRSGWLQRHGRQQSRDLFRCQLPARAERGSADRLCFARSPLFYQETDPPSTTRHADDTNEYPWRDGHRGF